MRNEELGIRKQESREEAALRPGAIADEKEGGVWGF